MGGDALPELIPLGDIDWSAHCRFASPACEFSRLPPPADSGSACRLFPSGCGRAVPLVLAAVLGLAEALFGRGCFES